MQDAQTLYQLGADVSGVRLKLDDLFVAPRVARDLLQELPPETYAVDWTRTHANFFRAVAIEKRMMFIILALIVLVAAINIISTLVVAVKDKQSDIAILRTLGAHPRSVMGIFIVQGMLMGMIGTTYAYFVGETNNKRAPVTRMASRVQTIGWTIAVVGLILIGFRVGDAHIPLVGARLALYIVALAYLGLAAYVVWFVRVVLPRKNAAYEQTLLKRQYQPRTRRRRCC